MQKAIFEWGEPTTPHSEDAVQVTQHFANYFVRLVVLSFSFSISHHSFMEVTGNW
jgi:hypothetical protein